jgi:hypothetical protein
MIIEGFVIWGIAVRRIVAALAAVATTACAGSSLTSAHRPAASARTSAASTAVPWSSIGPGWFLVSVDAPTTHLLLVDPAGRRYPVFTSSRANDRVVGWSGDGQRVLLQLDGDRIWPERTDVVDLRDGQEWRPVLPAGTGLFGFTRPRGLGLLTAMSTRQADGGFAHYRIERRSLTGADPVRLANDVVNDGHGEHALFTSDGTQLVVNDGGHITVVANATGDTVRSLVNSEGCHPVRMWDATRVLARCSSTLRLVPINGGSPQVLVRTSRRGPNYVDVDAFRLPNGLYTDSLGACGSEFVGHLGADGHVLQVVVPHTVGNTVPLTALGKRIAVAAVQGCEGPDVPSLLWFDPVTGGEQVIWAPRRGDHRAAFVPFQADDVAPAEARLP